jgi:hypothetical protein
MSSDQQISRNAPCPCGSESMGDILLEQSGRNMTLKTTRFDFEMNHWHLDTFLVEYKNWGMREFATFNIAPDGTTISLNFLGNTFERVEVAK